MRIILLLVVGGILFKIYVIGETIKVVRRFSLPDVSQRELEEVAGLFRFPRVSCAAATADEADLDPIIAGELTGLSGLSLFWYLGNNNIMTYEYITKSVGSNFT